MNIVIITHAPHSQNQNQFSAYAPYVREINMWTKFVDNVHIVAPVTIETEDPINSKYEHQNIHFTSIPSFDLLSLKGIVFALIKIPLISRKVYQVMKKADHIHLRCPGNIGLIACFVQLLFPNTPKTAKYAGNWDPMASQPWSYRLQKRILSNPFWTRNMQVLIYGNWQNTSSNIKSFFTASYQKADIRPLVIRSLDSPIRFLFVGTLSMGKRPDYALELIRELHDLGITVQMDCYGEGKLREKLEKKIKDWNLEAIIKLHGNQSEQVLIDAYQKAHFLLLPSQSEGWPKVVAEAMFWGCLPIASSVSCVSDMLGAGKRGLLLSRNLQTDTAQIRELLSDSERYTTQVRNAWEWSQHYTLDRFEKEIKSLIQL